jgi:hypothetical protein
MAVPILRHLPPLPPGTGGGISGPDDLWMNHRRRPFAPGDRMTGIWERTDRETALHPFFTFTGGSATGEIP